MLLLNPRPVTLTERVRRSLLQPDLCHRESEFFGLQDEARSRPARDLRLLVDGVSSFGALDLGRLAGLQDERNTPFTPAVHAYYAFVEALREFEEQDGRMARYRHYAALTDY